MRLSLIANILIQIRFCLLVNPSNIRSDFFLKSNIKFVSGETNVNPLFVVSASHDTKGGARILIYFEL